MRLAQMIDPGFKLCTTVAGVVGEMVRNLADSKIIPISPKDYAADLIQHLKLPMERATNRYNTSVGKLIVSIDFILIVPSMLLTLVDQMKMRFIRILHSFFGQTVRFETCI